MNCYETIDLMDNALEGVLAPENHSSFHEHLGECSPCRVYFEQLRATIGGLERLPRASGTTARREELISAYLRIAAGSHNAEG
jgi:predicted anti-sigma-YlaC factor YlaD